MRMDDINELKIEVESLQAKVRWMNEKLKTEKCERGRTLKVYRMLCIVMAILWFIV